MKPMGTVSRNTGGDIATIIPDVIDTDTIQVNASLNFKGDEELRAGGYYGSFFTNNVPSMSWQNWATGPTGTGTINTMSSTPSNSFNQINVTAALQPLAHHEAGRERIVRAQHAERHVPDRRQHARRAGAAR